MSHLYSESPMAAAAAAPPPPLDLCTVLTESKRIINAHSRHFLALSVLYLLPLSFSLTVFPTLQSLLTQSATHNSKVLLSSFITVDQIQDPNDPATLRTLLLTLLFSLFVFVFSLLAVGSITCSVFHGFYGRPVKLVSAIKSAFVSFFPLLITELFVSAILIVFIFLIFLVMNKGIELVGFRIDLSSPYFSWFSGVILFVLFFIIIHLRVNWSLVGVVVVVESSWGLEPLQRSSFLIKGMKRVALALLLLFGILGAFVLSVSSVSGLTLGVGTDDGWKSSAFIIQIVVTSTLLMLLLLYHVAAHTVLYMYCKAVHGELAWEIAEEFAREYVSLPFDDGKVPHMVSVAYN